VPYGGGSARSGIRVKLLCVVKNATKNYSASCLSTPMLREHQSITATVQFIIPSPFNLLLRFSFSVTVLRLLEKLAERCIYREKQAINAAFRFEFPNYFLSLAD